MVFQRYLKLHGFISFFPTLLFHVRAKEKRNKWKTVSHVLRSDIMLITKSYRNYQWFATKELFEKKNTQQLNLPIRRNNSILFPFFFLSFEKRILLFSWPLFFWCLFLLSYSLCLIVLLRRAGGVRGWWALMVTKELIGNCRELLISSDFLIIYH